MASQCLGLGSDVNHNMSHSFEVSAESERDAVCTEIPIVREDDPAAAIALLRAEDPAAGPDSASDDIGVRSPTTTGIVTDPPLDDAAGAHSFEIDVSTECSSPAEWAAAIGWCHPHAGIHEMRPPPPRVSGDLAWWRVIGPETRSPLAWRRELRWCSVYTLSSATFAACGVVALAAKRLTWVESLPLIAVGVTSFQADVSYLGIDHGWRTVDTVLAIGLCVYFVGKVRARANTRELGRRTARSRITPPHVIAPPRAALARSSLAPGVRFSPSPSVPL
jgi:hypothetical protein